MTNFNSIIIVMSIEVSIKVLLNCCVADKMHSVRENYSFVFLRRVLQYIKTEAKPDYTTYGNLDSAIR